MHLAGRGSDPFRGRERDGGGMRRLASFDDSHAQALGGGPLCGATLGRGLRIVESGQPFTCPDCATLAPVPAPVKVDPERVRELAFAGDPDEPLDFYTAARELGASVVDAAAIDEALTARIMRERGAI